MPRPTMDVNGAEYQEILKQRELYRLYKSDYPDVKWVHEVMDRMEKKQPYGDYTDKDYADFRKARGIVDRITVKYGSGSVGQTAEEHTTTHYIWRTQEDGKVRQEHAANDGKIFEWDNPPPTGNPGDAFGCRCWAEPYKEDDEELQEGSSQVVTFAAPDNTPAWTREDFFYHYNHGEGKMVRLSEIGHLQDIINHARTYNQGGGSIFKRVENGVFEQARQNGEGSFSYDFLNSYEFQPVVFEIGGATVAGVGSVNVVDKGEFWMIVADLDYAFSDKFTRPYDVYDTGIWPLTIETGTPYYITDEWSTRLEAIIKK